MKQNLKYPLQIIVISLIITAFVTCYVPQKVSQQPNVALLYTPGASIIMPEYSVYSKSDTESILVSRVQISDLLFNMANERKLMMAKMKIKYILFNSFTDKTVIDSASNSYMVFQNILSTQIVNYTQFRTPEKRKYLLAVELTDLLRNRTHYSYHEIDKTGTNENADYTVMYKSTYEPVLNRIVKPDSAFLINKNGLNLKTIYISQFRNKQTLPPPPFSTTTQQERPHKPDTIIYIPSADTLSYYFKDKGIMFFSSEKDSLKGTAVYNFGSGYPNLTSSEELIAPLVYLCSSKEYSDLKSQTNQKLALDAYWLKTAGNVQRAKELIRIFYNRVKYSNIYFASFTEGWQTDRGMVYILFGPPGTIFKDDQIERWIYGESYSSTPIEFTFIKKANLFTENDFELRRSPEFSGPWRVAVETWRKGKVYSYMNDN